jgi:hypothetical protein
MKKVLYFFSLICLCYSSNGQFTGLVVNEVSQGPGGTLFGIPEYIELIVVGNRTCLDSTADLSNWIIDDNNGWLGAATGQGTAQGHVRFSANANWMKVPFGSIILLYNDFSSEKNAKIILPDDPTDADKNLVYIVPISSPLIEKNTSEPASPSSANYFYPASNAGGYVTNEFPFQSWSRISLNNDNDGVIIVSPMDRLKAFFSIGYGTLLNPGYPTIYKSEKGPNRVYYLSTGIYRANCGW